MKWLCLFLFLFFNQATHLLWAPSVHSPSVLSSGRNKQKGRCDPWLQAAHYAVGEATSTDPKQSAKLMLSWKAGCEQCSRLFSKPEKLWPSPWPGTAHGHFFTTRPFPSQAEAGKPGYGQTPSPVRLLLSPLKREQPPVLSTLVFASRQNVS